jgi:broad specificity phosphatase PhoE
MDRMSEILFIRHAATDMAGTFCGHSDPEVNALGCEQITDLTYRLRSEDIGAVYTSDLRRAQTTAEAISKAFGVECHVRPALREISFGRWEGLRWKEIEQHDAVYANRWMTDYPALPAPGGERFSDFERRVLDEVAFLSANAMRQNIAVISHAGVLRTVLCSLKECNQNDAWKQVEVYCSIVRHIVDPSPHSQFAGGCP